MQTQDITKNNIYKVTPSTTVKELMEQALSNLIGGMPVELEIPEENKGNVSTKEVEHSTSILNKEVVIEPTVKGRVTNKKTTGISVYIDVWERWNEFKNKYPMYSGTDLMASALEDYMDKHNFKSFQTLVEQGKLEDSTKEA